MKTWKNRVLLWRHLSLSLLAGVTLMWALGPRPTRAQSETTTGAKKEAEAKTKEKTGKPEKDDKSERREILLRADHGRYNNKTKITRFTGHVRIRQKGETFTMECDEVDYDDDANTAVGTGRLKFYDEDTTITGLRANADFDKRLAVITGNVVMTSHGEEHKPGEDDEDDEDLPLKERYKRKKTVMHCDRIDYYYRDKRAVATGNVRFEQEDKHGTAGKGEYDEEKDIITLEDGVTVTDEDGQTLKCRRAVIYNADDIIEAESIESTFFIDEEEEEEGGDEEKGGQGEDNSKKKAAPGQSEGGDTSGAQGDAQGTE